MKKRIAAIIMTITFLPTVGTITPAYAANKTVVALNPADASPFNNGEFEGWGTSLCWWANRIGYDPTLTQAAADAFFSENGLGLDIARYNLGGGDNPSHTHVNRSDSKVPGVWKTVEFVNDGKDVNMTYDITKDQNQLNMAKAALAANPDLYFEGFSNSAPYFMTVSGCSSGGVALNEDGSIKLDENNNMISDGNTDNLKADMYDDFGKFIAEATQLFKDNGIKFQSYSPMNEPDTNYWGYNSPKQEGCHFSPGESQSKAIVETRKALDNAGLTDVLVAGMDETDINKSVANYPKLTAEAKTALGRIDTHTYNGNKRAELKKIAKDAGKTLWMSEVDGGWAGAGLAGRIIEDMNGMQPAAWVMWDIIDVHKDSKVFQYPAGSGTFPEANNSKNYTDTLWGVGVANHDTKELYFTNKYYTFGQFTKYINPGDTIIASSNNTLAAYNKTSGDIKIVANNSANSSDVLYEFDLSGFRNVGTTVKEIRSDMAGNEKWAEIPNEATLNGKTLTTTLKANTVTTYVISGNNAIDEYAVITGSGAEIQRGTSVQLSLETNMQADNIIWSVDNTTIAEISQTGLLTAKKPGTVTVTAQLGDYSVSKPYEITVYATINGANTVNVGTTAQMQVDTNAEGTPVWSVDNTSIATIDPATGVLTAVSEGSVVVTVTIGDVTATKTVKTTLYKLSGTPSWNNATTAPKDSDDYLKAADGDLNTYFDGTKNGYVMYDYGTPFKLNSVKLAARSGNGMADRTIGAKIQGSNDAITWTDLYTITTAIPAGSYTTVTANQLTNNKAYRYFRYTNDAEMANIAEFLLDASASADIAENEPTVRDIKAFTDDFEDSSNIFGASAGDLSADGNQVYKTNLSRYGNVFVPVKSTATAALTESITLTDKDRFRLSFNIFAGWEGDGKENEFSIKNAKGEEIIGFTISGGGYNLNQMRIDGSDLLSGTTNKPVFQGKSTDKNKDGSFKGANGWAGNSQNFANNMGFNKTAEIVIDGTGNVSIAFNGGVQDLSYDGAIDTPIDIKSLVLTGNYNGSRGRVVSYDNFDADVISYAEPLPAPAPPLEVPENNELINMNFDNGDLSSSSPYGKATGSPVFAEVDGKKCIQFDNTAATVVTLTDANNKSLLTGMEEITISFQVKPTSSTTSWWFFAAPSSAAQTNNKEQYLGCLTKDGTMTIERYNNNGSRPDNAQGTYITDKWNDVMITVKDGMTTLYINGEKAEQSSTVNISGMLGSNSVLYIGQANWGSGEYATGYLDNFVITKGVLDVPTVTVGDWSAVTSDITLPTIASNGSAVTWTSGNTAVITNDGKVIRPEGDSIDVTLTASVTAQDKTYIYHYTATVVGLSDAINTFTAYAENGSVKFTSAFDRTLTPYNMYVALYDAEGVLVGLKLNTASGSFDNLENGIYTASCYFWDNMRPTHQKVTKTIKLKEEENMDAYLFVHFIGTEANDKEEQIYFSVSQDGTTWKTLKNGNPMLISNVGEKGVRDPYILRGEDGKFFIIATDLSIYHLTQTQGSNNWSYSQRNGSQNIVVWESDDLVNWSEARLVKVALDNAGCTWAPEAIYDPEQDAYMVFWASKVSDDNYATQRMYRSYTKDFKTFTAPELYIDGGTISNIDTTITEYKGMYYRFTKNETKSTVNMMKCISLNGDWKNVSTYTLNDMVGYEGPTIYKQNGEDKWCLLLDYFSKKQGYKPFVTDDIAAGSFTAASDFTFDAKYRHGTVIPITQEEYNRLTAAE